MPNKICSKCGGDITDDKKSGLCPPCRSKMGRNNKKKGSAQELRLSKIFQKYFDKYELPYKARRTPRSGAIHEFEPSDLLFIGVPKDSIFSMIHVESKVGHNWFIEDWHEKAKQIEIERGTNREPIIIARKPNKSQDFLIVDAEYIIKLLCEVETLRKYEKEN